MGRSTYLRAFEEVPYTRHSRESGNPVRILRCRESVLDSRFRGNDAYTVVSCNSAPSRATFFHKL